MREKLSIKWNFEEHNFVNCKYLQYCYKHYIIPSVYFVNTMFQCMTINYSTN